MRGTATKTAVVNAIEGATIDTNAGNEAFRHVDLGGLEAEGLTDRVFLLAYAGMRESFHNNHRMPAITWQMTLFYGAYEGVNERMVEDAERIGGALWGLHTSEADICQVDVGEWVPAALDDTTNTQTTLITVTYQLTDGV